MLGKRKRKRKTRGGCAQHYLINQYYSLGNKIVEDFCQTLIFFFFFAVVDRQHPRPRNMEGWHPKRSP
jgi:hypothetical protein